METRGRKNIRGDEEEVKVDFRRHIGIKVKILKTSLFH